MADNTDYGGKVIIASRKQSDATTATGMKFSYETTHELKASRDQNDTATKDGTIFSAGNDTYDLSFEMISSDADVLKAQKDALKNNDLMEYWRIFLDRRDENGNVAMEYMQGHVSSFDESADADDFMSAKVEVTINGKPQDGYGTFSALGNGNQYQFTDLNPNKSVTGVTITSTATTVKVGSQLTLSATVQPDNASNKNLVWTSSDPTVLDFVIGAVAGSKYAVGKKAGTATVTVTTEDGGKKATQIITVTAA